MAIIKSKGIYNILNESIYQIETQCGYDDITDNVVNKEAKQLSETLFNYNYPKDSINAAIDEFYNYFSVERDE